MPEFSRLVALSRLGREPFRQDIEATPEERDKLAGRFGLLGLDRLAGAVALSRRGEEAILLEATFEAEFTQECVVTLEPVAGRVTERFVLLYGPPEAAPDAIEENGEDPAFEPLTDGLIDIGEAVAQELSLVLPEFPRHPDAPIEEVVEEEWPDPRLAALERLKGPPGAE
jgi:uncharacterized metal-binding protein YceD (DUF177 family)